MKQLANHSNKYIKQKNARALNLNMLQQHYGQKRKKIADLNFT
jgi:hypothetical protein